MEPYLLHWHLNRLFYLSFFSSRILKNFLISCDVVTDIMLHFFYNRNINNPLMERRINNECTNPCCYKRKLPPESPLPLCPDLSGWCLKAKRIPGSHSRYGCLYPLWKMHQILPNECAAISLNFLFKNHLDLRANSLERNFPPHQKMRVSIMRVCS